MKKWFLSLIAIPALLVGCNSEEEVLEDPGVPQKVDVEILTPAQLAVDEKVELAVHVTQGDENVDDAESVKFEVWESGLRDEGELLDGELDKDGVYKVDYTFDHDGVYYLYAHTTARGLHIMPKTELTVGSPDMSKVLPDDASGDMTDFNKIHEEDSAK